MKSRADRYVARRSAHPQEYRRRRRRIDNSPSARLTLSPMWEAIELCRVMPASTDLWAEEPTTASQAAGRNADRRLKRAKAMRTLRSVSPALLRSSSASSQPSGDPARALPDIPPGLTVGSAGASGEGLFSTQQRAAGTVVFTFTGVLVPAAQATPLALQIDADQFLESSDGFDNFLNHSCDPNCDIVFRGDTVLLVTRRAIAPGQELTFDYLTTEWDLFEQERATGEPCAFRCGCGSATCRGLIAGFRYLSSQGGRDLGLRLSPFLRRKRREM